MKKNGKIKLCETCGKQFYVRASRVGRFCSNECKGRFNTKESLQKVIDTGMKKCSGCKKHLPVSFFAKDISRYDALNHLCKECVSIARKKYRASDNGFEVTKRGNLIKNFKITLEEYNQILENQNGVCAICGREETMEYSNGRIKQLAVDHDHKTGKVRGLLCNSCNRGLGLFMDSSLYLKNAINYFDDGFLSPA